MKYVFLFLLIILALFFLVSFSYNIFKKSDLFLNEQKQRRVSSRTNLKFNNFPSNLLPNNRHVLGEESAPVTLVFYGDYQCPYSGSFNNNIRPQLVERYVKTGKVKWIFRDFAFLGSESNWSAEAASCAEEQGKYWEYHNYLFANQKGENQGAFSKVNLEKIAYQLSRSGLKLDTLQFGQCLNSDKYKEEVELSTEEGRSREIDGTPTIFVNGQKFDGLYSLEDYIQAIEGELMVSSGG